MKHFSLMLVPDTGPVRSYKVKKNWVFFLLFLFVAFGVFSVWGIYSAYKMDRLSVALKKTKNTLLLVQTHQNEAFLDMQSQLSVEHEKVALYARNLGELKARMVRLDALGTHLVKASKMNPHTFDFDVLPAMGGPRLPVIDLEQHDLGQRIMLMNTKLTHLDAQLVAIDLFLQGDREEKIAKPHAWPTKNGWLSSHFGMRDDPFTGELAMHRGVDIANHFGASVFASSRGVVTFSGKMKGYGYLIEIEHGYGYRTRYAHMSASLVEVGDLVEDAQLIGRIGSEGRSTGPHLHFEVLLFGKNIDPQPFLPRV